MQVISKLCLTMALVSGAPTACYGQLFWDFNQSLTLPEGWFDRYKVDGNYKWDVSPAATLQGNSLMGRRTDLGVGAGGGGNIEPDGDAQAIFEAYSPPFQFNDLSSSVLDFDTYWGNDPDEDPDSSSLDSFLISLVFDEEPFYPELKLLRDINLLQNQPDEPFDLAVDLASEVAGNDDFEPHSSYRIRLRVEDNNNTVTFIEVDNLQVTGAVPPGWGDTNGDGIVDIETDFEAIRTHFLGTGLSRLDGDLTDDGIVNVFDFAQWKDAFLSFGGSASAIPTLFGVPEPTSALLALIAGMYATALRRQGATIA